MAIAYRDPFSQLQGELERMLATAFGPAGGVYPPVNVFDQADAYVVKVELPGVQPDKVRIDLEDNTLVLRGERAWTEPRDDAAFHRREREQGQFRRVVHMPGRLASDEAKADYRDGVLTIRVPKAKESRPRRVDIQAA